MNLEINKRIKQIRKLLGYSQIKVAEMLGKKPSTYAQCEREGNITCDMLISLAEIFNIDVRILLYGEIPEQQTVSITSEENNKIILTPKEENYIKIIRNLNSKRRKDVIKFIESAYYDQKA